MKAQKILLLLILTIAPASASFGQEEVTEGGTYLVNASMDGYVTSVASAESVISPSSSLNDWMAALNSDECKLAPKIEEVEGFPGIFLDGLQDDGSALPTSAAGNSLAQISSPLLALQLVDAQRTKKHQEATIERIEKSEKFQTDLDSEINNLEWYKTRFNEIYVDQDVNLGVKTPDSQDELSGSSAVRLAELFDAIESRENYVRIAQQREYRIETIKQMKDDAQNNLSAAMCQIQILKATIAIGNLGCPKECSVTRVHVFPGQWVSKGDPVATIKFVD